MRKVLAILPFKVDDSTLESHGRILQADAAPRGTSIAAVCLQRGPAPADFSRPGFEHAITDIVDLAMRHQRECDGIMISCFEDPGLAEVRQVSRVPVVAPCETALQLARAAGGRFFIISPDRESEPLYRRFAGEMGLAGSFDSFVHVPFEIEGVSGNEALPDQVAAAIADARRRSDADLALLGCTAFTECYDSIVARAGGRIIEPARAAIRMLELLIDLQLQRRGNDGRG
jgi:allantoin racemase